jgi:hypothetical protein
METKMDTATTSAVEKQLAVELLKNQRIVEHPELGQVMLKRPNLEDDAAIGEARRKSYQRDMKNPDVLSRSELEKFATQRGMWDVTIPTRIQELMAKTGQAMATLEGTGFVTVERLYSELDRLGTEVIAAFPNTEPLDIEVKDAAQRLISTLDYTDYELVERYAPSTTVYEQLTEMKLIHNQIKILEDFILERKELSELQVKQTELFVDSIESRAEREQEYATLYHCCLSPDGKPIWPSIDVMKRIDPETIGFLIREYSYFTNGITPEFQEMLAKYGFLQRLSDTVNGSDDTPVQPESKLDGVTTDEVPTDSSPVLALVE